MEPITTRPPDYELSAYNKTTERGCRVGVGWSHPNGRIKITLGHCIVLDSRDPNITFHLFPIKKKSDKGEADLKEAERDDLAPAPDDDPLFR